MNEYTSFTENQELNKAELPEEELSHSDKAVGVITEPKNTYASISKFPPKTVDWLVPVLILLALIALSNILMMSNNEIRYQVKEKQREKLEQAFNEQVAKGNMTREQADEQIDRMADMGGGRVMESVFIVVGVFIGGFIVFFLITGIFYLFSKLVLKGEGTYTSALVANGLTAYIGIIQVIAATILAFLFGRMINDVSAASLMNIDSSTITGFLLAKLDIFSIWSYIVLGIGLAFMFKSRSIGKYIIMVFALWLIGGLLLYFIVQAVPFLQSFRA